MTSVHGGRIYRFGTVALLFATVATGCSGHDASDGDDTTYPNAPRQITSRWWLAPDVAEATESSNPEEVAAAEVLQSFFGSDSAEAMATVSVGPAAVFADFMIAMEAISGHHPIEEVISRRVPRVVGRDQFSDVQIDGEITEDRGTGSGRANRTTFDQFVMRSGADGQLRLIDFQRDGIWISELVATGDDVISVETEIRIVAVIRSSLGRYMVAGELSGAVGEQWLLSGARLESIDGALKASGSFSEVGEIESTGSAPFLVTFDDGGLADHGARLILPPLDAASQNELVFEIPSLGVPRVGGDVSGG